jgi:hypothetical protein
VHSILWVAGSGCRFLFWASQIEIDMKPQLSKYISNFFFATTVVVGIYIFTGGQNEWAYVAVIVAISLAKLFSIISEQGATITEQENEIKVLRKKLEYNELN